MIKIRIVSVGKNKESWLEEALKEYGRRLERFAKLEWVWVEDDCALVKQISGETIALDPNGPQMSSEDFSNYLFKAVERGGSRLTFVIGGPEGLPPPLKKLPLLGLSKMTFTHQIARLILAEQIFRAFEIERGTPYHK